VTKTRLIAVAAAVIALTMCAGTGTAVAGKEFYKRLSTECLAKPNPLTGGHLVAAKFTYLMGTYAHPKNNLRSMKLSARLIPNSAGANWFRAWESTTDWLVKADGYNRRKLTVTTEYQNAAADWNLDIKLKWDRTGKPDWKEHFSGPFNEGFCAVN
jgi:hypothetical protein